MGEIKKMNREIKFRAWNKLKKCFSLSPILMNQIGNIFDFNGELTEKYEITQYIGLKDKEGKEIYEGDVIEYFDWCYMRDGHATKENHKIIHSYTPTCGIRAGEPRIDYYNPLYGIVQWNNDYSTYEPLISEQDDYNCNCFYNVILNARPDICFPDSYCKVIGNKYENPELLKLLK